MQYNRNSDWKVIKKQVCEIMWLFCTVLYGFDKEHIIWIQVLAWIGYNFLVNSAHIYHMKLKNILKSVESVVGEEGTEIGHSLGQDQLLQTSREETGLSL